ncbi:MAG TPA: redoxin domain-containing protein [Dehalococcoidia bacterium]|nr:redoxin domain-containing protein [Dehalococcoidia bacterium]
MVMLPVIGEEIPEFSFYDTNQKRGDSREFIVAKTPCALLLGVFTDVCTKELCQLDSFIDKFNRANVKVIGVSCYSPFALKMCIPK